MRSKRGGALAIAAAKCAGNRRCHRTAIAPPAIVMVRITQGNTSAIAASGSTPSRPI